MPIMAKTDAANRNAIALLMQRIVLVAVPRVRRRDVFDMERRALNATGLAEKVKLVVGDNFEKCGSAGWDGACSKVIGDSAENFVHEIKPRCNRQTTRHLCEFQDCGTMLVPAQALHRVELPGWACLGLDGKNG